MSKAHAESAALVRGVGCIGLTISERSNDLLHWQTTLFTADPAAAASALRAGRAAFVSPGLVSLSGARLGYSQALLARDPDGHVMQLASE